MTATTTTTPSNDEIMEVLGLTATSTEQLCSRLRDLFVGDFGTPLKTIEEFQQEVFEINDANGWFEQERAFGEDIALLHSEVSEMFEAYRDHGFDDATEEDFRFDATTSKLAKPEGVGSEAADIFIRLVDTCRRHKINLRFEVERKNAFNRTRGYRHGGKRV